MGTDAYIKKYTKDSRILTALALLCMIVGTVLSMHNPDFVPFGIGLYVGGAIFFLASACFMSKAGHLQEMQKENRIKQLEEEVKKLKQTISFSRIYQA